MFSLFYKNLKKIKMSWLYKQVLNRNNPEHQYEAKELQNSFSGDLLSLKDYQQIASYNWSEGKDPVIIIPGKASHYEQRAPMRLMKLQHAQMVDENRHRQNDYPLESLFRAVQICSPGFDFKNIDFATDRNNLRKLLNFVEGSADEAFRIDFQKVGNLVALIRHEEQTSMFCDDYGKDFENKYTRARGEGSHRRIVTYKFGEHNMLVRFEVDCVEQSNDDEISLVSAMGGLKIKDTPKCFDSSSLSYVKDGDFKNENLMELTTKSATRGFTFPEHKWNQLFFSKTDFLVIGWHERGNLKKIEKLTFNQVTERSNRNRSSTINSLAKLNDLLKKIKEIADNKKVYSMVYNQYDRKLSVYECELSTHGAIPDALVNEIENTA